MILLKCIEKKQDVTIAIDSMQSAKSNFHILDMIRTTRNYLGLSVFSITHRNCYSLYLAIKADDENPHPEWLDPSSEANHTPLQSKITMDRLTRSYPSLLRKTSAASGFGSTAFSMTNTVHVEQCPHIRLEPFFLGTELRLLLELRTPSSCPASPSAL